MRGRGKLAPEGTSPRSGGGWEETQIVINRSHMTRRKPERVEWREKNKVFVQQRSS